MIDSIAANVCANVSPKGWRWHIVQRSLILKITTKMDVKIYLPNGMMGKSDSDTFLISMLRNIAVQVKDEDEGWPDKYGASKDNDTFKMSPFCWCDKEDCPQCWDQDEIGLPPKDIIASNGMDVDEDGYISAPNFWHKKSGLKVWWYKYIGRSMKISHNFSDKELKKIESDCLASLLR